jgi:hypothetical protein
MAPGLITLGEAAGLLGTDARGILQLMTDGALPGLFGHLIAQVVHPIDGALVMLPG